jgi:hypothetical protein
MRGTIPPLPSASSWRGVQLSTGISLPLPCLQHLQGECVGSKVLRKVGILPQHVRRHNPEDLDLNVKMLPAPVGS